MPLSEFIKLTKGKVGTTQQKASHLSTDLSHGSDSECFELVWQNGQIMMQGQSSRTRKTPIPNDLPTFISKRQDGKDPKNSKMVKFSILDPVLNDFPLSAPSCATGLDQDDETVPWLHCPTVEPFNNEYCSEFLPEPGAARNELFKENSLASIGKRRSSNHPTDVPCSTSAADAPSIEQRSTFKDHSDVTELNKLRIGETSPLVQSQHTIPRSGNSGITQSDAAKDFRNSVRYSSPMAGSMGSKLHKLDAGQSSNPGLMNFSYFSRFASLPVANLRNRAATTGAAVSSIQRIGDESKGNTMNSRNSPALVTCSHQESGVRVEHSVPPSVQGIALQTPTPDPLSLEQSEALFLKDSENDKSLDQPLIEVVAGGEKAPEPAVAPSSVCSGNRLERVSNDPGCNLKRKSPETGDSESCSDEAEEESVGFKKTAPGRGSKRSRAAEVHNLSERRRRERINEKMRALQELIPNCNKVDKASMLDEAIEYLKTLQLQVQILSMGSGLYMPSMMLPAAMQQLHRAHMSQFSPIGMGMGMGMGFGMGINDVNYGMTQMPNIQGPCYPVTGPPISTSSTFHGAVGSGHQVLGHPAQELLMSMPCTPLPLSGIPHIRLPVGNVSAMPSVADLPPLVPSASSREIVQNGGTRVIPNDQVNSSTSQDADQATALRNDHYPAIDADEAQNPGGTNPS